MASAGRGGAADAGTAPAAAWQAFEGADVVAERVGRAVPAASEEDLSIVRHLCLELGFGGFVVRKGTATFRPWSRQHLLEHKAVSRWDRSGVLHVAPPPAAAIFPRSADVHPGGVEAASSNGAGSSGGVAGGGDVVVVAFDDDDSTGWRCSREALSTRSGYFASVFRHSWSDTDGAHTFVDFPGGQRAFAVALAWLSAGASDPVGPPWPLRDSGDVIAVLPAAAYLDAPRLLHAAVRSWCLSAERPPEELLEVAAAVVEASLQFDGGGQELVSAELRDLLQDIPRHQLPLSSAFLVSPCGGLAMLELRSAARETLAGHLLNVGGWVVGAVIQGGQPQRPVPDRDSDTASSAHDFAVRLLDRHEGYFLAHLPALRRLLLHVDASHPVLPPLCFRVAAAAVAAMTVSQDEVFAGVQLAVRIFERSLAAAESPAEAAADPACTAGLFGAGTGALSAPLGLEVLVAPLVPPASAAVILSRVLSSWAAGQAADSAEADGADLIFEGIVNDRQRVRAMLAAALPRIADCAIREPDAERGGAFDLAVPELRAAFARAVAPRHAAAPAGGQAREDAVRLLFRVLFQPTGGLPGIDFPLAMLGELRAHNKSCIAMAARCAVDRLRGAFASDPACGWRLAEEVWSLIGWEDVSHELLEEVVLMVREWLMCSRAAPVAPPSRGLSAAHDPERAASRLLLGLPLLRLSRAEELLGPPVPAHVIAALALRSAESVATRMAALEAGNEALRRDLTRLERRLNSSSS